jgi:hypothetical protein
MRLPVLIVVLVVVAVLYAVGVAVGHHQRSGRAPTADDPPPAWAGSLFGGFRRPFDRAQLRLDGRELARDEIVIAPGQTVRLSVLAASQAHRVLTLAFPVPPPRVVRGALPPDGALAMEVLPSSALDLPADADLPSELVPNRKDHDHPERWPWPLGGKAATVVLVSRARTSVTVGLR